MSKSSHSDAATINRRTALLGVGAAGVFGVLSARLFYLQVTRAEDYRVLSEDNRFNFNLILPKRGEIRDRFGEGLAVNSQDYRAELIPERTKDIKASLDKIGKIIPLSLKERARILKDVKENPRFAPVLIKDHLDWSVFSALNIQMHDLAGIIPKVGSVRAYPNNGIFSHTLGYVGRAAKSDIEKDTDPLLRQPTFKVGKTGVEAAMEGNLRGASGRLKVEVNARGRIVREWPDPKTQSESGKNVYITLDAELQRFAAKQFVDEDGETDSGGIAVIDIMTGELRTLLSMPIFDGNLFVSGLTQTDMDQMNNDPKRPQFNKVLGGGYPPASTYKMVVMLAALESGLISPDKPVFCLGKIRLGNRNFHCWKRQGHGAMTMRDALKNSCDSYFYEVAQIVGIEAIADMARRLGLGQTYNIGINGQRGGIVPDPAWKRDRLGTAWREGDTLNASIGQGFTLATPLQLAVMSARLANAQKAVSPSLLIGGDVSGFPDLAINPTHLAFVRDAMWGVCNEIGGTAFRRNGGLGIEGVQLAGKTGTGQVRGISTSERNSGVRKNNRLPWKLRDHSIFVGFAPYDKPRFAIGTIIEHGGSGSKRAANVTRAVMSEALKRDGLGDAKEDATHLGEGVLPESNLTAPPSQDL